MDLKKYIKNSLISLGLSEGEAIGYFGILQNKEGICASELKKIIRFSTAGTYKVINGLIDKGYVLPVSGFMPVKYLAVSLDKISKKFANEGRKMSRFADKFDELGKLSDISSDVDLFEGDELIDYYLNLLYKGEDFTWCVGSFDAVKTFLGVEVEKEFIKKRVKSGIYCDALIFDKTEDSKNIAGSNKREKRDTKFVSGYDYPLEFSYLFGDHFVTFYRGSDNEVKVLKSDSPDLARAKLLQYQMMWNACSTNE